MGQPGARDCVIRQSRKRTQGTETSKYLQEKKVNTIPPVVASERGIAQTGEVATPSRGNRSIDELAEFDSGKVWKGLPQDVRAVYAKSSAVSEMPPE